VELRRIRFGPSETRGRQSRRWAMIRTPFHYHRNFGCTIQRVDVNRKMRRPAAMRSRPVVMFAVYQLCCTVRRLDHGDIPVNLHTTKITTVPLVEDRKGKQLPGDCWVGYARKVDRLCEVRVADAPSTTIKAASSRHRRRVIMCNSNSLATRE
jgi:hypothetical protein